jgi:hypothetical protein
MIKQIKQWIRQRLCQIGIHDIGIGYGAMSGKSPEYMLEHWGLTKLLSNKYCKSCSKKFNN